MPREEQQAAVLRFRRAAPQTRHAGTWFALVLALLLAVVFARTQPFHNGDVEEYAVTTAALARHLSPDIRDGDVAAVQAQLPQFAPSLAPLRESIAGGGSVKPGFYRGRDGNVYAIHFFAYPALAALPYRLLPLAGIDPFKAFLAVNMAFVLILGCSLQRLLGSPARAAMGVLLFMLCGGLLYGKWSSPELMSAAALLSALSLYLGGSPVLAGLLAGVAATHNPPIVFFAGFAPLLRVCASWQGGIGLGANLKASLRPRDLAGALLAGVLFALSVAFNLWAFGVPSIIGKVSTAIDLATANRLHAFFFDLNQGMIIGVPGLFLALLACVVRGPARAVALAAGVFSVGLALPALVAHNWNSAAEGMMRYAFWGAMPLLFAYLWRVRTTGRWPAALLVAVLALQLFAFQFSRSYNELHFSPLARWVLTHAPAAYNPDPEIFDERAAHRESFLDSRQVDVFAVDGKVTKAIFNLANPDAGRALCGEGKTLAPDNHYRDADRQWRYVNGPIRCVAVTEFAVGHAALRLVEGWSGVETNGGAWNGAWSQARRARLVIETGTARPKHLILHGHYFKGNKRTRVRIDGMDAGWQALDAGPVLAVPASAKAGTVEVELEFDAPHQPAPGEPDQRALGFFLQNVTLI